MRGIERKSMVDSEGMKRLVFVPAGRWRIQRSSTVLASV